MYDAPPYLMSIAPMMEHTDRFFRVFMRLLTQKTWFYTEMISSCALIHGDADLHLAFDSREKPVVLQLGGSNAQELAQSVKIARDYDYDEINLNVGCPSDRVHHGGFGASLMARVDKTQKIVQAMCESSQVPITVKCRIGIDGTRIKLPVHEDYEYLLHFAKCMYNAGATRLAVHARIAVLGGLSPKQNREIPPLKYEYVRRLKKDLMDCLHMCFIEINGGIKTLENARQHLRFVDAVMMGRAAVTNPYMFSRVDALIDEYVPCTTTQIHGSEKKIAENFTPCTQQEQKTRELVAREYGSYLQNSLHRLLQKNTYSQRMVRMHALALKHSMNLFSGTHGAKQWRHAISSHMRARTEPLAAIEDALRRLA